MDLMDSMDEVDNARQGFVHVGHREFRSSAGPIPVLTRADCADMLAV